MTTAPLDDDGQRPDFDTVIGMIALWVGPLALFVWAVLASG